MITDILHNACLVT